MKKEKKTKESNQELQFRNENQAMEFLRRNHPQFFKDSNAVKLAAVICFRIPELMEKLDVITRAGVIAAIESLMYQMGSSALKTIRDPEGRGMTEIFYEESKAEIWPGKKNTRSKT